MLRREKIIFEHPDKEVQKDQLNVELYNECQEKFNKVNEIQTEIDRLNKKLENLNQLQANI